MPDEIDDERLSALLEGRLQGEERDELLARLAADEGEDYEVFARTARSLREMEEEDAAAASWRARTWAALTRAMVRLRSWRR